MIPFFILTYNGIDILDSWFDPTRYEGKYQFFLVDNGRQTIPDRLKPYLIYTTTRNIGCAGGYNLMMHMGFDHYKFDKIVIGQEDSKFEDHEVDGIWEHTNETQMVGAFGNGFTFALVSMMKAHRDKVGRWDENFILARREDNDYIQRCKLAGVDIFTLDYPPHGRVSVSPQSESLAYHQNNVEYYYSKWGNPERFTHPFNDSTLSPFADVPISSKLKEMYGEVEEYPSITEFKRFQSLVND